MMFGLVMHAVVLFFRIPFPGYVFIDNDSNGSSSSSSNHKGNTDVETPSENTSLISNPKKVSSAAPVVNSNAVPVWMYFFLMIPALFDVGATALCMMGLRYINVSIYQMLRGSGIIFVAIMKQHVLKDRLYNFQWLGVFWNVISVIMVGATALFPPVLND